MNLRIDLILESEQRSASLLDLKMIKRIGMIAGPAILALALIFGLLKATQQGRTLKRLEKQWAIDQPRVQEAAKWQEQMIKNRDRLTEIQGWKKSRIDWHKQLVAFAEITPENIQYTVFRLNHSTTRKPGRAYSLRLEGLAVGEKAEDNVQNLVEEIEKGPFFKSFIKELVIADFRADPSPDAQKHDRRFSFDIIYSERPLE